MDKQKIEQIREIFDKLDKLVTLEDDTKLKIEELEKEVETIISSSAETVAEDVTVISRSGVIEVEVADTELGALLEKAGFSYTIEPINRRTTMKLAYELYPIEEEGD